MLFNIPEEQKNKFGIYCITNLKNNNKYIGQTTEGFYQRYLRHSNLLKNNTHFNKHLQRAYNKQNSDDFEMTVIDICSDINKISELEEKYISEYRAKYKCYNYLSGGPTMQGTNNPFYGKKHSSETIRKISLSKIGKLKGEKNNFYGKDHSGEKNGFYGKHHTEETRKIMSEKKKELFKDPKNNPFYGKHHSEETKEKLKDNWKNAARKVMCVETGIIYDSVKIAAKETSTCAKSISAVCCGTRNMANNLHWVYVTNRGGKPLTEY